MAKERAEKLHKKAEKPEKKVSKDKVKKQKKEKKSKRVDTPEESDNEFVKIEDTPAAAEKSSAESVSEVKPKKEKKEKKSKKAALEEAVADRASNGAKLPARPISKDSDSDSDSDSSDDDDNGAALFAIDTKPTPIDPNSIPQKANDAADEDDEMSLDGESKGPSKMKPPTGLNRQARRRIRLIEKQREKIAKDLGAGAGADEVQAKLDKWVEDYDSKAAARLEKKQRRKEKEAARIRNKKGKLLTGRRLKERKKVLDKMDKKASKRQGLSAQNSA
ncbi:hypothetical protein F5Y00DRAFT_228045 [Daldinia vernicosa]|uniref:uncharacterized protein n=1 Tax=Daldinia vernicosa TaxID=114800 RepID=UPI0020081320|nr:uncharacterized protein F5Y00DRAFT_228045 [Daldinia vernicosa]KAI0852399.1 hypothetical protein F5Y00DRAFT_228045 [Daldinia vernicosa]